MKIEDLYTSISNNGISKITNNKERVDTFLRNIDKVNRMGIAILIRLNDEVKCKIQNIENELKEIDSNQYYYPKDELHITLLSIIPATEGFKYTDKQIENYNKVISSIVKNTNKFKINLKGIIASDSAVIVKGYYQDELEKLRKRLREDIIENGLELKEIYKTMSSHVTISRFKEKLQNKEKFIQFIKEHNNYDFGEFEVSEIEFTYHGMYGEKREVLYKYILG